MDTPALFLEFAEQVEDPGLDVPNDGWLYGELETEKNFATALEWVQRYGVLGLSPTAPGRTLKEARDLLKEEERRDQSAGNSFGLAETFKPYGQTQPWSPRRLDQARGILDAGQPGPPAWRNVSTMGGSKETVTRFVIEAIAANSILRLYEAATASKRPKVDVIRTHMPEGLQGANESPRWHREWALTTIWQSVDNMVRDHCHPVPYRRRDGAFMTGWGFRSLLGAMWLQMLWLLTAPKKDVRRCLWCDKVIDFEQPKQPTAGAQKKHQRSTRKIRKDKLFCDPRHKAAYDYHMRRKLGSS